MRTNLRYVMLVSVFVAVCLMGCTSGPAGTYSDDSGAFVLQLKSGGAATFTFAGMLANCTYKSDAKQVSLACEGDAGNLVLTMQNDGSLVGPPGTFMPPLKKK